MSEATTAPTETLEEEAPMRDVLDAASIPVEGFADESRIPNPEVYRRAFAALVDVTKRAAAEAKRYGNITSALAVARVEICSEIILPSGIPDWRAKSDAYRDSVTAAEVKLLGDLGRDGKTTLDNAVKQQKRRKHLLPRVAKWVILHEDGFAAEREACFAEDGELKQSAFELLMASPTTALKTRVRAHYASSELNVPPGPFAVEGEKNPPKGGPDEGDAPANPLDTLGESLAGLGKIAPHFGIAGLLMAATGVAEELLTHTGEVTNRPEAIKQLRRVSVIATVLAKHLDGKEIKSDEMENVRAMFWTKNDIPTS